MNVGLHLPLFSPLWFLAALAGFAEGYGAGLVHFRLLRTVADRLLPLTPIELSLLETLVMNRGRVQSTDSLERSLYDHRSYVTRNTIEAHVSKLRRKLRDAGAGQPIQTRRGFGYLIP